ncbi:MAG: hypothetical protein ACOYLF_17520 [Blastocatellia bacterium]
MVDFNQALNPLRAFTVTTTRRLRPRQNRLKVAVERDELNYRNSATDQAPLKKSDLPEKGKKSFGGEKSGHEANCDLSRASGLVPAALRRA